MRYGKMILCDDSEGISEKVMPYFRYCLDISLAELRKITEKIILDNSSPAIVQIFYLSNGNVTLYSSKLSKLYDVVDCYPSRKIVDSDRAVLSSFKRTPGN
jgi:hypothetical protein